MWSSQESSYGSQTIAETVTWIENGDVLRVVGVKPLEISEIPIYEAFYEDQEAFLSQRKLVLFESVQQGVPSGCAHGYYKCGDGICMVHNVPTQL